MESRKWTIEKIKAGFDEFLKENGRYPTAVEIDTYKNLPSSRQIQRVYGGLVQLRKKMGIEEDFTKGEYSSNRAKTIGQRAHKIEKDTYEYLKKTFGVEFVHREYFFSDDRRNRTDFYVHHTKGNFSVDVFYPKDTNSFSGCINSKLRTYEDTNLKYPVIFLMMNDSIPSEIVKSLIENKKNKLKANQIVMTLTEFKEFCGLKGRISILK